MEKFFKKKSEKRAKEWKIVETKDEIQSDNLNSSKGDYLAYKQVKSEYTRDAGSGSRSGAGLRLP